MKIRFLFFLLSIAHADNWAILIAGSNSWENYRHQADLCHAYHSLTNRDVSENNIIVMMYDDIAYNSQNPTPGVIINEPNGPNVYSNVPKHYTGNYVTPTNIINILKGNTNNVTCSTSKCKVLTSMKDDNVFIYFVDHGAPGLVAVIDDVLYADQLYETIKYMHEHNMYKQLIFYLESCESGSMFSKFDYGALNVYAITAATPYQSSYACDYDPTRNAFLNDCFSINWLKNVDSSLFNNETFLQQYKLIKNITPSTVCEYGNLTIADELIDNVLNNYINYTKNSSMQQNELMSLFMESKKLKMSYSIQSELFEKEDCVDKLLDNIYNVNSQSSIINENDCNSGEIDYECWRSMIENINNIILNNCNVTSIFSNEIYMLKLKYLVSKCYK